ncbi:MAG: Imm7 family immunity protein [Pseudomonadota bacterium]
MHEIHGWMSIVEKEQVIVQIEDIIKKLSGDNLAIGLKRTNGEKYFWVSGFYENYDKYLLTRKLMKKIVSLTSRSYGVFHERECFLDSKKEFSVWVVAKGKRKILLDNFFLCEN